MRMLQQVFSLSHFWLKFTFSAALSNEPSSALQGSEENTINNPITPGGTGTLSQCLRRSSDNVWKAEGTLPVRLQFQEQSWPYLHWHIFMFFSISRIFVQLCFLWRVLKWNFYLKRSWLFSKETSLSPRRLLLYLTAHNTMCCYLKHTDLFLCVRRLPELYWVCLYWRMDFSCVEWYNNDSSATVGFFPGGNHSLCFIVLQDSDTDVI